MDADLLYNDEYVDAVYNPESKTEDEYEYEESSGFWTFVKWFFGILLLIAALFGLAYLFFGKRWNV